MSDLLAKCDWLNGDVLVLTLPQDPSSIHVRLFDSKHAPRKVYVPESYPKQWELGADYLRLAEENAKLRELCRHLYACNQYCDREDSDGGCSACPYQSLECDCGFEERLLELGIEVVE